MKRSVLFLVAGLFGLSLYGCGGGSTVSESYPKYGPNSLLNSQTSSIKLSGTVACLDNVTRNVDFEISGLQGSTPSFKITLSRGTTVDAVANPTVVVFQEYASRYFLIEGEEVQITYTDANNPNTSYRCTLRFNGAEKRQQFVYSGNPAEGEVDLRQRIDNLISIEKDDSKEYISFTKLSATEVAAP